MGVLDQVNRTHISKELLGEALNLHSGMAPDERGTFEMIVLRLMQLLEGKGLSGQQLSQTMLAINFRLMALARIAQGDEARGWTMLGDEPGMKFIHSHLVTVAADEPLIEVEGVGASFNTQSFKTRVLQMTAPEGSA